MKLYAMTHGSDNTDRVPLKAETLRGAMAEVQDRWGDGFRGDRVSIERETDAGGFELLQLYTVGAGWDSGFAP